MTIETLLAEIQTLPLSERQQLVKLILETLPDEPKPENTKKRSITELRGLGKEMWNGVDAQEYVNQIRSEWDHRP